MESMRLFVMMTRGEDRFYSFEIARGYCDGKYRFCRRCFVNRDILKVISPYEADFYEKNLITHQKNVARLCTKAAKYMDLEQESVSELIQAALLHDIGKIFIPADVFMKDGRLSFDEYELVKYHAAIGALYLKIRGFPESITDAVKHHHERYDGAGYPAGLKGDSIPFFARILAVCDAADAMLAGRYYRAPISRKLVIDELLKNSRSQFDPDVVKAVIPIISEEAVVNV